VAGVLGKVLPRFIPPGFGLPMPTMTVMVFVWAAISAVAVALLSVALPAMRLAKMDIATALSGRK
jgi:ABC-type antimicrobial peptide transport system permease subunit